MHVRFPHRWYPVTPDTLKQHRRPLLRPAAEAKKRGPKTRVLRDVESALPAAATLGRGTRVLSPG